MIEKDKFIDGPEMADTLRTMVERTGLSDGYFTYGECIILYNGTTTIG